MFDGKVTVVPIRPNVQTNYYNEAKLNEYGLTPPQNWDELLAFAKTLHEKEGVGRVAIQAASGSALTITCLEFIRSAAAIPWCSTTQAPWRRLPSCSSCGPTSLRSPSGLTLTA